MTTLIVRNSINRPPLRHGLVLITLVLACFGLLPQTQAALPPEIPGNPDGCYPAFNTAEGCNALEDLGLGIGNTGLGWYALSFVVDGSLNTAVGAGALDLNTGSNNTAVGSAALLLNETGTGNTAVGAGALAFNDNANANTAVGLLALGTNTIGAGNTAVGAGTLALNDADGNTGVGAGVLALNVIGRGNTAIGVAALALNNGDPSIENSGSGNTAVGARVLITNTTGFGNTAVGVDALTANTQGQGNTALGAEALTQNTEGAGNTAIGARALKKLSGFQPSSSANTAVGAEALTNTTEGNFSTAVGAQALSSNIDGRRNTAIGSSALASTTGDDNIAVGTGAGVNLTMGDNNIDVGNAGVAGESATIRIGTDNRLPPPNPPPPAPTRTFIAGIFETTTGMADAINVVIDSQGQLGTMSSSVRFKREIKTMDKASESILALKPVTFHYKSDNTNTPQFGLIAEEVAKVNPNLVVRNKDGEIYTVRYEAVNAMLLNEFLKARRQIDVQQKQIDALTAGLQKVSAQLEVNKPAPQMVVNKP